MVVLDQALGEDVRVAAGRVEETGCRQNQRTYR
jgi:hypothetical protein